MGAIGLASRGAKAIRPVAEAVRTADDLSQEGGHLAILPGDPAATRRLREIIAPPAPIPSEDALALLALTPASDVEAGAAALAHRRRSGGGALAILVGSPRERRRLEARLLVGHRLEPSNVVHVPALEGAGERDVVQAVIRALGDETIAAGRRNPGLRPEIGASMVRRAARRSAAIGALPLPGVDMPVLVLIQVRLVADLAALHDRPFGAERALEALAIVGAGFGWRAIGRSASGAIPVAGWAVRGGVAYGATRTIGETALARLSAGHDLIEGAPVEKARPVIDRITERFSR
jgi:uncharacterized protein (DUF697 family)